MGVGGVTWCCIVEVYVSSELVGYGLYRRGASYFLGEALHSPSIESGANFAPGATGGAGADFGGACRTFVLVLHSARNGVLQKQTIVHWAGHSELSLSCCGHWY